MSRPRLTPEEFYRRFYGRTPDFRVHADAVPDAVLNIARVRFIGYVTDDGEEYMHEFRPSSRPVMGVTDGGKLHLSGGRYRFDAERGIIDT